MITINLLPPEFRKKERTPFVILLPMLLGLTFVLSAAVVTGYVRFVVLAEKVDQRTNLEESLSGKKLRLVYRDSLLAEETDYKKWADTIRGIAEGRILMTRKLDQMVDLVTAGETMGDDGYTIWLTDVKTTPAKQQGNSRRQVKGPKPGGEIGMKGYAIVRDENDALPSYNRFHRGIKQSRMFQEEFVAIGDPDGNAHTFSDDLEPKNAWVIDLKLVMRDPAEVKKLRKEAEKNAQRAEKAPKPGTGQRPGPVQKR